MKRARVVETSRRVAVTPAANRGRRLSEGALVQASVRARLLGIPLLRLDARVLLTPASSTSPLSAVAAEDGLAEAVRSIDEGADVLDSVRRNGRR